MVTLVDAIIETETTRSSKVKPSEAASCEKIDRIPKLINLRYVFLWLFLPSVQQIYNFRQPLAQFHWTDYGPFQLPQPLLIDV
ncbi:hypothetical protein QG37_04453 [Candidozyma auris]|uniref:Uncharacterized protein n=1 Tax=Candidozyma auris TaxID=498019 RepID=A0A0L0NWL8_CANAR|nr:hypothetical protein QG37_04453 [[Candida] auris]